MKKLRPRLPRNWSTHSKARGVLVEKDLAIRTLHAKLLIFRWKKDLYHFWKHGVGWDCGPCNGVVNNLGVDCSHTDGRRWVEYDPRYFCVIGMVKSRLSAEVTTHEAVHAAIAYASRMGKRSPWFHYGGDEPICYPAGLLASKINDEIWKLRKRGSGLL